VTKPARRERYTRPMTMRAAAFLAVVLAAAGCIPRTGQPAAAPAPPVEDTVLAEGAPAPDVAGLGTRGKPVRLSSFRGKLLVLFFYPMDFAAGSTAEVKEFAADLASYQRLGAVVAGVSTDDPSVHADFAAKNKLRFPLLSDADGTMARAFGVPLTGRTAAHVTFLIDRGGVIRKVWKNVRPWGHSEQVLAAAKHVARR
jgi:peroxiredoxin Q/BCP